MNELIDNLSKICENCKYRGIFLDNYPCSDCLVKEQDNGNLTGCVVFTKFSPIDATCIPKHSDAIHRYLDKLKEEGLITSYDINTIYMDDKPYCTDIKLYKGKHVYAHMFSDLNDENLVIEILADCVIKLYREIANDLMEKVKEDK